MERRTQKNCVSSVTTNVYRSTASRVEVVAVESSGEEEIAPWQVMEDADEGPVLTGIVGVFLLRECRSEKASWRRQKGGAGRSTRPLAARISRQRSAEASQKMCRYRLLPKMMEFGYRAMKGCTREEHKVRFRNEEAATEWFLERICEASEKAAKDEAASLSVVQGILLRSTDFLRRIIAPVGGQGGVTLSYVCPRCNSFSLEDHIWWVTHRKEEKACNWWCATCGCLHDKRAPNRMLVVQVGTNASRPKVFKAHAAPHGLCENLVNALKLLANQQVDGDSPIESIVKGLHEKSRIGMMSGLRRLSEADNHKTVEVGQLNE